MWPMGCQEILVIGLVSTSEWWFRLFATTSVPRLVMGLFFPPSFFNEWWEQRGRTTEMLSTDLLSADLLQQVGIPCFSWKHGCLNKDRHTYEDGDLHWGRSDLQVRPKSIGVHLCIQHPSFHRGQPAPSKHLQESTHQGGMFSAAGQNALGKICESCFVPVTLWHSILALAPPFEPFVSVGNYHPNSSRLPQCTSSVPLAMEAEKACYCWKTVCMLRGCGWEERRRICGQSSSTARGSQVARDGRFVWLLAKQ